jgi:hypothetical protein
LNPLFVFLRAFRNRSLAIPAVINFSRTGPPGISSSRTGFPGVSSGVRRSWVQLTLSSPSSLTS